MPYMNEEFQVAFAEMSMSIVKAAISNKDGAMRLNLVNSDTGEDTFGECMSLELFNDFINRAENDMLIPEPFKDVVEKAELGYWNGGPPYLSVSHYRSGGGKNVPGEQEVIYLDGEKLKSKDILYDNPLGRAVWKSVHNDLYEEKKDYPDTPVRVSIGFLDFEHKHVSEDSNEPEYIFTRNTLEDTCPMCEEGVGGKVYLKGHLVHKAFTRVPAHPRTLVEIEMTEKSDAIISKKQDAESIIDDLAEELVGKSAIDDMLVVKADEIDYRQYANKVESAFSKQFSPPPRPYLYVSSVTDKGVIVTEYDPNEDDEYGMGSRKVYKIGYKEKDGKFTFDKRSNWVEMDYGLMPKKSEANDDGWEIVLMTNIEIEEAASKKSGAAKPQHKLEVTMGKELNVPEEVAEEEVPAVEEEKKEEKEEPVVVEESQADKAVKALMSKIAALKSAGKYGEAALHEIQEDFNALGEVVKNELATPAGQVDLVAVLKAAVAEVIPTMKNEIVAEVVKQLKGYVAPTQETPVDAFVPRSLTPATLTPAGDDKRSQIEKIAARSVGLKS